MSFIPTLIMTDLCDFKEQRDPITLDSVVGHKSNAFLTSTQSENIINTDVIALYTGIIDITNKTNPLTVYGTYTFQPYTSRKNVLYLDGVTRYELSPYTNIFNKPIYFHVWINTSTTSNSQFDNDKVIFSIGSSITTNRTYLSVRNDSIWFNISKGAEIFSIQSSDTVINDSTWHLISVFIPTYPLKPVLYIDGIPISSIDYNDTITTNYYLEPSITAPNLGCTLYDGTLKLGYIGYISEVFFLENPESYINSILDILAFYNISPISNSVNNKITCPSIQITENASPGYNLVCDEYGAARWYPQSRIACVFSYTYTNKTVATPLGANLVLGASDTSKFNFKNIWSSTDYLQYTSDIYFYNSILFEAFITCTTIDLQSTLITSTFRKNSDTSVTQSTQLVLSNNNGFLTQTFIIKKLFLNIAVLDKFYIYFASQRNIQLNNIVIYGYYL